MYNEFRPDLVTLDIQMEGGDGILYLQKIMQKYPDARVMMVSSLDQEETRQQAFSLGALAYVTKPFQANEIFEQTKKALTG